MVRVVWTPIAQSDLDDILYYIAFVDRNRTTGERIYSELRSRVRQCAEGLFHGRQHPDAPEGWYYVKHKRWLIFYRNFPDGIEVMRVIDAVRDLPRHLRDR
jgi:plasmid stabilization system protein ParE